ncbi:unnamed protein product [Effrenium voratum]|uniref:RRM domain-containing protein n=1 Tax=Effrenium voratum TaxID=2562239 RepID=A0AA36NCE1_9DINO|nr:unnamed protein product [Effrenium voratum]CAJ1401977.1 unnamed protein product [Effrenium voratum]CAJ1444001.1 unnamed protein product [Effrenium voratum]
MLPALLANGSANSNLYVSGLPPSTSEEMCRQLFREFGEVASVRTFYGKTPTAPSYGFVKFKTDAMALAAITGMNGREFNGHVMSVRLANNDTTGPYPRTPPPQPMQTSGGTNLYVSGLPPDLDEARMKELFQKHGNVVSVKLAREARIYKQYGFVHYTVPEEAEAAINAMHNRIIDRDYQLTVKYANSSEKNWRDSIPGMPGMLGMPGMPGMAAAPPPVASTGAWSGTSPAAGLPGEGREDKVATVHITGLPPGTSADQLQSFFGAYGQVNAKVLDDGSQGSPATALLRLPPADAERLVTDFDGHVLQGLERPLSVRVTDSRESWGPEREEKSSARWEPYKASEGPPPPKATGPPGPSIASSEFMVAISETVSRVKGFRPVLPHTMDPTNLYIKGLPSNADELYLYSIFSPFGAIQSVRLLRDSITGLCTGAALLKFGQTEDAELAIRTLSGNKLPDGVVLDVTVKTVRA